MTFPEAKKILPKFASGLPSVAETTEELRQAVVLELRAYGVGENPLDPKQPKALQTFLDRTSS